jgi:hypothetical protein
METNFYLRAFFNSMLFLQHEWPYRKMDADHWRSDYCGRADCVLFSPQAALGRQVAWRYQDRKGKLPVLFTHYHHDHF